MYCNRCGTFMPDTAEFCPNCGNRVQQTQQVPVREERAGGGRNSVIIGAIAAVAVVLVVCIVCFTIVMKGNQDAHLTAEQSAMAGQQTQENGANKTVDSTGDKTSGQNNVGADNAAESKTDADEADVGTASDSQSTVTNNYYYYGSSAAKDNDYYTSSTSSDYLWPSDTCYLSFSDLSGLNQDTVAAIRNEIYARHGYAFTTSHWQDYFAAKTWYHCDSTCTESTINSRLSSLERANISTIVSYEESKGWR